MEVKRNDIESKLRASGSTPERAYALSRSEWTSIDFNKSGKQILIGTNGGVVHTIDGFEGTVLHSFQTEGNSADGSSHHHHHICQWQHASHRMTGLFFVEIMMEQLVVIKPILDY